ncbi:MAG: NUDIX hydrolase, partial [Desulfobacteraceae bacterium 4572_35.1]
MKKTLNCPQCNCAVTSYRNPFPTVDIIIQRNNNIVLIERKNPPFGWAIPGGFVDYGESLEQAATREALEETSLQLVNLQQFRAYSDPARDLRHHTISFVFSADGVGNLTSGDDAIDAKWFPLTRLPQQLCFD